MFQNWFDRVAASSHRTQIFNATMAAVAMAFAVCLYMYEYHVVYHGFPGNVIAATCAALFFAGLMLCITYPAMALDRHRAQRDKEKEKSSVWDRRRAQTDEEE